MLTQILYFVLAWIGGNTFLWCLWSAIQPGEAFDKLFKYNERVLWPLHNNKAVWSQLLYKALGGCEKCFAFWFSVLWFLCYVGFCQCALGGWMTAYCPSLIGDILIWLVCAAMFISISAFSGLLLLIVKNAGR